MTERIDMLDVTDIQKSFGDFKAISHAELHVKNGEVVAVIGPNGAGKTTLFNLITGQLKPDKGSIKFQGDEITSLSPYKISRKGIARSFQIANIFPRLTVFENVQVAVLSREKKSRVLFKPALNMAIEETWEILNDVGLKEKAHRLAGTLSHGDQRILEIAIALGSSPRLLILDEPTAGMSPEETSLTMDLIKSLKDSHGLTILFCEHDMDIVFSVAESIMVMHQGKTIIQAEPEKVRRDPLVQEAYLGGDTFDA